MLRCDESFSIIENVEISIFIHMYLDKVVAEF